MTLHPGVASFYCMLIFLFLSFAHAWQMHAVIPQCAPKVCERSDVAAELEHAGIVNRLVTLAEQAHASGGRVDMAFMSFSEPTLFHHLCRLGRAGLKMQGFFDWGAGPPSGLAYRLQSECQSQGDSNIQMHYMGRSPENQKGQWRLHHNKYFIAQADQSVTIAFGSANLTGNGLAVNFENWNFLTGTVATPFIADHLCNVRAMRAAKLAPDREDDPQVFRAELSRCLSQDAKASLDDVLMQNGVWALFAPDADNLIFKRLKDEIDSVSAGGHIRMAVYFFLHRPLVMSLQAAVRRGVRVELLIDDDIQDLGSAMGNQRRFYRDFIKPDVSGFVVRRFDTNEAIYQMQHNKFLVIDTPLKPRRVFAGAGQFTQSAFENNYENFYFIQQDQIVQQFADLFDRLWSMAEVVQPSPAP